MATLCSLSRVLYHIYIYIKLYISKTLTCSEIGKTVIANEETSPERLKPSFPEAEAGLALVWL